MERLQRLLPWLGPLLLLTGLVLYPVLQQLPSGRFGELLLLGLLSWGLGALLRRVTGIATASAAAGVWLLPLLVFAGPLPVLFSALMALACAALGMTVFPRQPLPAQVLAGALLLAGTVGWLLPLPIHHSWLYLPLFGVLVYARRQALRTALVAQRQRWQHAVAAAPGTATLVVIIVGLASTGTWLPTLQYDDLAYHLRLPWQLLQHAAYVPAPEQQVWAVAPWASDVLHALPQLIARQESRGAVNALWLLLMASGVWRLASVLGAAPRAAWLAVGLACSLPLTAGLGTSMQTEPLTAAVLVWMAALIAGSTVRNSSGRDDRFWWLLAVLGGGMLAVKLTAAAMAAVLVGWALLRHPWPRLRTIIAVLLSALAVGGASYAHAAWLTGNPVLPLFNGVFQSSYFAPVNFADDRWHAGFGIGLDLLWRMTFDSGRYLEAHAGAAGFALVALAGLWLLALLQPRTRSATLACTVVLFLPLLPIQYLRYAYPGMVLLCAVFAAAAPDRRPVYWLLIATCVLNVAYLSNGNWMLRAGAMKYSLGAGTDVTALLQRYAPERALATAIRASDDRTGNVLLLSPSDPFAAEFGRAGRTVSWYAPHLQAAASAADADASGAGWMRLLQAEHVRHIIARDEQLSPAQQQALQALGARPALRLGGRTWWQLPATHAAAATGSEAH